MTTSTVQNLNIQGTKVPGGGFLFDEQTAYQITNALNYLQGLANGAQSSATTAQDLINALTGAVTTTTQNNGQTVQNLQNNINTLNTTVNGLTYVASIDFNASETGAITFAGSAILQSGATFTFVPSGATKREALPYVYTAGDTFLLLTPSSGHTAFTLPAASSVPNGYCIEIRNMSTSFTISVSSAGSDTFNGAASPYPMTTLGSAFSGVMFRSDGVSDWITMATAG